MTTTWVAIASILVSLVVGVLGQVTAWITLRHNAKQAQDDRTWRYKVEMYIDLLGLLSTLSADDFTIRDGPEVHFGRSSELKERIAELRLDGRMAALGSPDARKFWDAIEGVHGVDALIKTAALGPHTSAHGIPEAIEQNKRALENVIRTELGQKEYTDELRDM